MRVSVLSVANAGWNEARTSPCGCLQVVLYKTENYRKEKNMPFPHSSLRSGHLTWFIGDGTLQLIIPDIIKPHVSPPDTSGAKVCLNVCVDFTWSGSFLSIQIMSHRFTHKISLCHFSDLFIRRIFTSVVNTRWCVLCSSF